MTNPVSRVPSAQLPFMDTVITSPDGTPTLLFHRFFTGLWQRTGGAAGVSSTDVAQTANQALTTSVTASDQAAQAQNQATSAQTVANSAAAAANTAQTTAATAYQLAGNVQQAALAKSQNLADLTSVTSARINLGVAVEMLSFCFDTCPGGLRRGIPIVRPLLMPANFAGTGCYSGIAPTNDAMFLVSVHRSGGYVGIGSIVFVHGGTGIQFSTQAGFSLNPGDTLVVQCPAIADSTLAQVGITFPLTLA